MKGRTRAWLGWSLWALSLALTALGLLLLSLNLSHPNVPVYSFWAENVLFSIGYSTVGAVIVPRMSQENPIGWLFCAIGLLWAVLHFIGEYAINALLAAPGSLPAGELASWVYSWLWIPGLGLSVFLCLLFPNGRLPSARWRWFARLSALLTFVAMGLRRCSQSTSLCGCAPITVRNRAQVTENRVARARPQAPRSPHSRTRGREISVPALSSVEVTPSRLLAGLACPRRPHLVRL
jgi:hypothetical protein